MPDYDGILGLTKPFAYLHNTLISDWADVGPKSCISKHAMEPGST